MKKDDKSPIEKTDPPQTKEKVATTIPIPEKPPEFIRGIIEPDKKG